MVSMLPFLVPSSVATWAGTNQKDEEVGRLTCPGINWSPPNADTHGLMPPVPKAMTARPIIGIQLKNSPETFTHAKKGAPLNKASQQRSFYGVAY